VIHEQIEERPRPSEMMGTERLLSRNRHLNKVLRWEFGGALLSRQSRNQLAPPKKFAQVEKILGHSDMLAT
jgi:hypothetical protein